MSIDSAILEKNIGVVGKIIDDSGKMTHVGVILRAPEGEEAADYVLAYKEDGDQMRYMCLPIPLIKTCGCMAPPIEFYMIGEYYMGEGIFNKNEAESVREILEKNKEAISSAEKTQ